MQSNYTCLNSKTFDIEERKDIIPVDERLAKSISILNKKGYYIKSFSRANIFSTFFRGAAIHNLIQENLIKINIDTKDKIKNIIKQTDYESTLIVFKEETTFNNLPNGYKLTGRELIYKLSPLKESDDIKFKSLVDLDHELTKSLKDLEEWAKKLPEKIEVI